MYDFGHNVLPVYATMWDTHGVVNLLQSGKRVASKEVLHRTTHESVQIRTSMLQSHPVLRIQSLTVSGPLREPGGEPCNRIHLPPGLEWDLSTAYGWNGTISNPVARERVCRAASLTPGAGIRPYPTGAADDCPCAPPCVGARGTRQSEAPAVALFPLAVPLS